ncbi:MAG: RNA 2'-phosphotransferase [Anaerolineae bacterium]|nr:RNA 2'-phosphotransferase [Anaerolineae bacterium]
MPIDYIRLSKTVAHALRHAPEQYGLELNSAGWVAVDDLLAVLRVRRPWCDLTVKDLEVMIAVADKKRYELDNGRIRAYYGHSLLEKVEKTATEPPEVLYHGTSPAHTELILVEGLKPMSRQYVHLSSDHDTARQVGSRHDSRPVILVVRARRAHVAGIDFYLGNDDVWLAEAIPTEFIDHP